MKQVKTARGRVIDMGALAKANEDIRAVSPGNITMNARGDHVDQSGNVSRTVQSKSRALHDTTHTPEQRRMSDTPGNTKPGKTKKTEKTETLETDADMTVASRTTRTRDDGSRYVEIEYDDGSIETQELEE